jgi:hypothetical protein
MRPECLKIPHRERLDGDRCVYCGDIANEHDHFPPRAFAHHFGLLLPTCTECNRGNTKRVLRMKRWDVEDLEELGWTMRKTVQGQMRLQEEIRQRLAWNAEAYFRRIARDSVFAQNLADNGFIIVRENA